MTESDSSIPQKVAALAEALEAIRAHIGSKGKWEGSFYSWLRALGPDPDPWDGTPEEARERVLTVAADFVEAVDTAKRILNTLPVSVLEPLSPFTDGVRWDLQTRRTLNEIQASISILRYCSTKPDFLLSYLRVGGNAPLKSMQLESSKFLDELSDRIIELQCLPHDDMTDQVDALASQRRLHQEPVANPNGNPQSDGDAAVQSSKPENQSETDDRLPKRIRKDSPSRLKAKAAYDYAMARIENANQMTAVELFDAIFANGEAKEMLPPTAESFTRYLNDCGIRLRKSDTKPTSSSVVQRSDT